MPRFFSKKEKELSEPSRKKGQDSSSRGTKQGKQKSTQKPTGQAHDKGMLSSKLKPEREKIIAPRNQTGGVHSPTRLARTPFGTAVGERKVSKGLGSTLSNVSLLLKGVGRQKSHIVIKLSSHCPTQKG